MWNNLIKIGGTAMILNELVKKASQIKQSQENAVRRTRTKNIAIGAGIGTFIGVAAGILFAPKTGKETRQQIVEETGKVAKSVKKNMDAVKTKIADSAKETGSKLHEAGAQGVDAAKESLKEKEDKQI
ncbi:YtxH domain-containing protein [Desulfobacter latus]|uniref:YtxH domain-containing protein n=1 Tax=Desulfobacter latus TaxID=2292 RepID=A0A850T8V0_9BACT|nr:YtxH domain-containing protein [Desulfobacter latus]NWH03786.1 YtxH domain-containing protein [Desulfobacter latus]